MVHLHDLRGIHRRLGVLQSDLLRLQAQSSHKVILSNGEYLPKSLFVGRSDRRYIHELVRQINSSYNIGIYDGCAVLLRKLIETLIIELYESQNCETEIKDANNQFFDLGDLITAFENQNHWNLARTTKANLKQLRKAKSIGDQSAHSRRWICHQNDLDDVKLAINTVVREIIGIMN